MELGLPSLSPQSQLKPSTGRPRKAPEKFRPKSYKHPKYGEDLYPRNFLINLPHSSNYLGAEKLFGIEGCYDKDIEDIKVLPLIRNVKDSESVIRRSE